MKDQFTRAWIIEASIPIVQSYTNLTLRALYYRLVADHGMTNSLNHYKRVVAAMTQARWDGSIAFNDFVDLERSVVGRTRYEITDVDQEIDLAKREIRNWMNNYSKNRWENQEYYVEVFIEKKALQMVFETPCRNHRVALSACKGYPSLTFLEAAKIRLENASFEGKKVVILYYGDYDPSGEDIPRSIEENINRMGFYDFELERRALFEKQVVEMGLPPAPTKRTDSRSRYWNGLGQVELDAIEPNTLAQMCSEDIEEYFDQEAYDELVAEEEEEREVYRAQLKEYVQSL